MRCHQKEAKQDDFEAWKEFMQTVAKKRKIQVVGDDLTVTSPARLKKALNNKSINGIIVKPNQNGKK